MISITMIALVFMASSSSAKPQDKRCPAPFKNLTLGAISAANFHQLSADRKVEVIQNFAVEGKTKGLAWESGLPLNKIKATPSEKRYLAELERRALEKSPEEPHIPDSYRDEGVVSVGKRSVIYDILRDTSTGRILGVDSVVIINGAKMPNNYKGPDHLKSKSEVRKKGGEPDGFYADVSWNFGGLAAEFAPDGTKILEEDYSQTWTGF